MDEVDLNSRGLVPMSVGMLPGALVGSSHRHPFNLTSLLLHNTRGYSNQQKGATGPRVAPLDSHLPHLEHGWNKGEVKQVLHLGDLSHRSGCPT